MLRVESKFTLISLAIQIRTSQLSIMTDFSSVASSAENAHDSIESISDLFLNDIDLKTIDVETIRKYVRYQVRIFAHDDFENYSL